MSIKPIEEQLRAVQLKYDALKGSSAPLTTADSDGPASMQFTTLKPSPMISVETLSEKNDVVETMLKYILETYGKEGKNILTPTQENLLPHYIECHLLGLLKKNSTDSDAELHTILQVVQEAGERIADSRLSCSAMRSFR